LIDLGADVNATTKTGVNSLIHLCKNYKNENLIDLIKLLISKGIDIHVKTKAEGIDVKAQTAVEKWNALDILQEFRKNDHLFAPLAQILKGNILENAISLF